MNENLHNLALQAGLYCDGVPDCWDEQAIETYTRLVVLHLSYICRSVAIRADESIHAADISDLGVAFAQGQSVGALACAGALIHWLEECKD